MVAAVVMGVLAAVGVLGAVAYTMVPRFAWCPFVTSSGVQSVSPGSAANRSFNATTYPPGTVLFSAAAHDCHPPYTITWNLGPGQQSVTKVPGPGGNYSEWVVHVYPGPGYYPGSVHFQDSAGETDVTYFCADATAWPTVNVGSGVPAPACP